MVIMSLFDKDLALKQAGGNAELAKELFEILIKDLPISLQVAVQAHANQDKEAFWNAVHKIHGGTAYCGVPNLKSACKALEDEIKKAYPGDAIDSTFNTLKKQISQLLNDADKIIALL